MKAFDLEIKTIEKKLFAGSVLSLTAQAADGKIGILPDHAPLATVLAKGSIRYTLENGQEVKLEAGDGFLIVDSNRVAVLLTNL